MSKEETKEIVVDKPTKKKKERTLWKEFKAFIAKGNVLDMAVGVIMGGAFNAIVTAFTKILMSICTWGVPGGISGLVTVLPAATNAQRGLQFLENGEKVFRQSFELGDLNTMVINWAASQNVIITTDSDSFVQWKNSLLTNYTLHGTTYTYNMSAVIDWGTFINAVISFLIISVTLFVILKVYTTLKKKRLAFEADLKAKAEAKFAQMKEADVKEAETK
jgi:large conductance mechanosensitive channel protein